MFPCAIGFSGVIFGLKVLDYTHSPEKIMFFGVFPVHQDYAFWAELILIQVFAPQASFSGHLCGILAGLIVLALEGKIHLVKSSKQAARNE